MRAFIILVGALAPGIVVAQGTRVYGGVDGGFGMVQIHRSHKSNAEAFWTTQSAAFAGLRFDEKFSAEVAYLLTVKTRSAKDNPSYRIRTNMIDLAMLYYSTKRFPGLFIRPSVGVMVIDGTDHLDRHKYRNKESSVMLTFGIGYEYQSSDHVSFRGLYTSRMAWHGDRMNGLKVGVKYTF